jgi:hypothetical protein
MSPAEGSNAGSAEYAGRDIVIPTVEAAATAICTALIRKWPRDMSLEDTLLLLLFLGRNELQADVAGQEKVRSEQNRYFFVIPIIL